MEIFKSFALFIFRFFFCIFLFSSFFQSSRADAKTGKKTSRTSVCKNDYFLLCKVHFGASVDRGLGVAHLKGGFAFMFFFFFFHSFFPFCSFLKNVSGFSFFLCTSFKYDSPLAPVPEFDF